MKTDFVKIEFYLSVLAVVGIWLQTAHAATNESVNWAFIRTFEADRRSEKSELEHDKAWLTFNITTGFAVQLWTQSTQCHKVLTNSAIIFQNKQHRDRNSSTRKTK